MLRHAALVVLATAGCSSESALGERGDVGLATTVDTAGGPTPNGGDDSDYWGPNEDSFTPDEEPPWIWETGDTSTPGGGTIPPDETGGGGTPSGGTPPGGTTPKGGTGVPPGGTPPDDTGVPTITPYDTGITDDEICEAAALLAGFLDPWQTPNDGRVYYCHNSSGSNWTFVESDIASCLPHLNHSFDVFPTTGCDS